MQAVARLVAAFQAGAQVAPNSTGGGKAAFTRRGSISPPREPSRVPRSFGRISPLAQPLPPAQPRHGQSIFEVLRTMPLTAPAPGSDRRLSGEAHQVGGHPHRSDHEPHGSVPAVPRRQLGTRATMLLRRERAHLHTGDLPRLALRAQMRASDLGFCRFVAGQSTPG
jgi:hypothetical protein